MPQENEKGNQTSEVSQVKVISKENLEATRKVSEEKTAIYNKLVSVKYGIRDEAEVDVAAHEMIAARKEYDRIQKLCIRMGVF